MLELHFILTRGNTLRLEYKIKKGKYSKHWPYMGGTVHFLHTPPHMLLVCATGKKGT